MVKLPVPSLEETEGSSNLWAKKLYSYTEEAAEKALKYGSIDLQVDALNLQVDVHLYIENSERPTTAKKEKPAFTVDPSGVKYVCLATPE
jgi:hypothetical protein